MSAFGASAGAGPPAPASASHLSRSDGPSNLADVLERVLDKGIVIAGDIQVNLLDIELLTIKLRLIVASVDTARRMGLSWWEQDPWLAGGDSERHDRSLPERVRRLERQLERASGGDRLESPQTLDAQPDE
jgi:Gas vesicle protein